MKLGEGFREGIGGVLFMSVRLSSFFKTRRRIARATAHSERGATAVEMALIAPAFFLLLMGIVEFSLMLAAQQLLDNATYNATRAAKTGYTSGNLTQLQTVTQILDNELVSYGSMIDITKVTLTSTAYDDFASIGTGGTTGMGSPDQIVVYTVTYPWKFFTPMMGTILGTWDASLNAFVATLTSRIVVRNEPFG